MHDAIEIANSFIQKHLKTHDHIDPMKLQKLCYLAYGWHWALFKENLFGNGIEAWKYGPVLPDVYYKFKDEGREIKAQYRRKRTPQYTNK